MEKIIICPEKLDEYISNMRKHINEFSNVVNVMNNNQKKLTWESTNKEKALIMYSNLLKDCTTFTNNMNKFIDFLEDYRHKYYANK